MTLFPLPLTELLGQQGSYLVYLLIGAAFGATLTLPDSRWTHTGGRDGVRHSEHLGHLLTEMQWLQRAYPDATW